MRFIKALLTAYVYITLFLGVVAEIFIFLALREIINIF